MLQLTLKMKPKSLKSETRQVSCNYWQVNNMLFKILDISEINSNEGFLRYSRGSVYYVGMHDNCCFPLVMLAFGTF